MTGMSVRSARINPQASLPVGVVVERRDSASPWQDYDWSAVAVVPGAPPVDIWRILRHGPGWAHFHAATLDLELFRKETEGYKTNLSGSRPAVYVVLRRGEEAGKPEVVPFKVTACPYEAQDYLDSGDDLVEAVAMPEPVIAFVKDFIDRHHVDEPFVKRERKPYDPRKGGFGRRPPEPGRG
jgi:hypothetical protein